LLGTRAGQAQRPVAAVDALPVQEFEVSGPVQILPGRRVVTSWTIHTFPSGSLKEQNDP